MVGKTQTGTLTINSNGTQLSYIDSGVPLNNTSDYATIFTLHGLCFPNNIFQKVVTLAPQSGMRIVAINRRDYPGSSPLTSEERAVLDNGTSSEREQYLLNRGSDIAFFIDTFAQKHKLPGFTLDEQGEGTAGGAALVGWSAGGIFALATIASEAILPDDVRTRLARFVRAFVLQDVPDSLGEPWKPHTPKMWTPSTDASIPMDQKLNEFDRWLKSYYNHGDLTTQNPDVLDYKPTDVPIHPPTSATGCDAPGLGSDELILQNCHDSMLKVYESACFGAARSKWPLTQGWKAEEAADGDKFEYRIIDGANHFMHWDHPEKAVALYQEIIDGFTKHTR